MNKLFAAILMIGSIHVWADWHSWDEPPAHHQLYLCRYRPPNKVAERHKKILFVSHYNPVAPLFQEEEDGWYDANPDTLWRWFHCDHLLFYIPWNSHSIYDQWELLRDGLNQSLESTLQQIFCPDLDFTSKNEDFIPECQD